MRRENNTEVKYRNNNFITTSASEVFGVYIGRESEKTLNFCSVHIVLHLNFA